METDTVVLLRADIAGLRNDISGIRQDIGILEEKADSLETWRIRYLVQEDQVIGKLFAKIDDLVAGLGDMRAEISHIRGERDAERRISMMVISISSAACGRLITSIYHG